MKKLITKIICTLPLILSVPAHALITKVESLYHPATKQTLLLAHDTHLDYKGGKATQQQQNALTHNVAKFSGAIVAEEKTAPPQKAADLGVTPDSNVWHHYKNYEYKIHSNPENFIGELDTMFLKVVDITEPINPDNYADMTWQQAYQYAPMHQLTKRAKKQGVNRVENVECRFLECNSIATVQLIDDSNNGLISLIKSWHNDPALLQEGYAHAISDYHANTMTKYIQSWCKKSPSITAQNMLHHPTAPEYANVLLTSHNARLLDAVLLHKLYTMRYEPLILALCGSDHYTAIKDTLIDLGYDEQKTYGQDDWSNEDRTHWIIPALDMDSMFKDVGHHITARKICDSITPLMPSALNLAPFPVGAALRLV